MLPKGFAESILFNDISLVLSDYSNREALNKLIQLYMVNNLFSYNSRKELSYLNRLMIINKSTSK